MGDFIEAHAQHTSLFPTVASAKVVRKALMSDKISGASQLAAGGQHRDVNMVIVHAADQPFGEAPTQATMRVIPFLDHLAQDTSSILPSPIHMVQQSSQYAMQVVYNSDKSAEEVVMPCQKVLCLIRSKKPSKTDPIASGFKLTTDGVEYHQHTVGEHPSTVQEYTVTAFCSTENVTAYRLDYPRGAPQHALVTLSSVVEGTFVVDQVQHNTRGRQKKANGVAPAPLLLGSELAYAVEETPREVDG